MSDGLNHASIIDGMRLSKAPRKVYPHADVGALREVLREAVSGGRDGTGEPYRLILVVTDGVFSMDGDIAPLPGIVEAAEEVGAAVFVDDAHASGVLGGMDRAPSTTSGSTAGLPSRSGPCRRPSAPSVATSPAARTCATS